jgi:hypothetical protein
MEDMDGDIDEMTDEEESDNQLKVKPEEDALKLVDEEPVMNRLRFTLMRIVRLVLTTLCEAGMLVGGAGIAVFGFMTMATAFTYILSYGDPTLWANSFGASNVEYAHPAQRWELLHSFLFLPVAFAVTAVAWGQALALGMPFRWKNSPPNSMVVRCDSCRKAVVNHASCDNCGAFNKKYIVTSALYLVNVLITMLWVIHDMTFGLIAGAGFGRK